LPEDKWDVPREVALTQFEGPHGDKRQELVFIGIKMDKKGILDVLKKCLLTPEEMALGPTVWEDWEDNFDEWDCQFEEADEDNHDH